MTNDDTEPEVRPLRVVVADDHPVVRDGLAALLKFTPGITVADTVADGRAALRAAVMLQPDVLVMDIQMPGLNGVEATAEISRAAPKVAILMLTMFDDDESVFAAMRAGALGYLLKGAEQDQILRAIHAVADGEAIFGPGIASRVLGYLSGPGHQVDKFPELTTRERDVLGLLAAGLPNTAISNRLGMAPKTVSNHISAILTKLQVASRAEAAQQARAAGLGNQRPTAHM
ncbi:DNA-binding response regulator [Rhizocola hellebori]|uniref:DNA-binding response regulator n=1 Tax=Rhizocola hellebori TaxID=1392758 RepID=A0A8J3Q8X4_9ACTN|nr:response regulator transcription factor [Rhizocola hellebori]GIH05378.1 DNA-binding response regulator [Rhizocola hellebori]